MFPLNEYILSPYQKMEDYGNYHLLPPYTITIHPITKHNDAFDCQKCIHEYQCTLTYKSIEQRGFFFILFSLSVCKAENIPFLPQYLINNPSMCNRDKMKAVSCLQQIENDLYMVPFRNKCSNHIYQAPFAFTYLYWLCLQALGCHNSTCKR